MMKRQSGNGGCQWDVSREGYLYLDQSIASHSSNFCFHHGYISPFMFHPRQFLPFHRPCQRFFTAISVITCHRCARSPLHYPTCNKSVTQRLKSHPPKTRTILLYKADQPISYHHPASQDRSISSRSSFFHFEQITDCIVLLHLHLPTTTDFPTDARPALNVLRGATYHGHICPPRNHQRLHPERKKECSCPYKVHLMYT